jgi:very-short-patch-repair endonuclease
MRQSPKTVTAAPYQYAVFSRHSLTIPAILSDNFGASFLGPLRGSVWHGSEHFPPVYGGGVSRSETEGALMRGERKTLYRARDLRKRMTDAELILWSRIRPRAWPVFRLRRQPPIGPYIADFACPLSRIVIEVDGATHSSDAECAHHLRRDAYRLRRAIFESRFCANDTAD